jgi:hypothetical protein
MGLKKRRHWIGQGPPFRIAVASLRAVALAAIKLTPPLCAVDPCSLTPRASSCCLLASVSAAREGVAAKRDEQLFGGQA